MNKKILTIFVISLLFTFGMGFSLQSFFNEDITPSVEATSSTNFGRAPLNVSFSYDVFSFDGEVKKCLWDFKDGTKANDRTIIHTFQRNGTYNVSLTLWNQNGDKINDFLEIYVIEYYTPQVSINANNTYGKAPLTIQFTAEPFDLDGNKFEYQWDFDDEKTSSKKNPKHTFHEPGEYTVHLTLVDMDGQQNTDFLKIYVIDNHQPTAFITADKEEGGAPLTVEFNGGYSDTDGDEATYHWYFENTLIKKNRESTEQNPTHTFYSPGKYLVKFTVKDEEGATDTDTIEIVVKESLFSKAKDFFIDLSLKQFFNGSIAEFFGDFFFSFLGNFLGKISSNLLARII